MSKIAVEQRFGQNNVYRFGTETYTSTGFGLGPLMVSVTGTALNTYAGPIPISVLRPVEYSTPSAAIYPAPMRWANSGQNQIDWFFLADNSAATTQRKIVMCQMDRTNGNMNINGYINLNMPIVTIGAHTVRAHKVTYDIFSAGTVAAASGSYTLTGFGATQWTSGLCSGNRIGFGGNQAFQIPVWYEISGVVNDSSIVLSTPLASNVASGTPYVAEDLRILLMTTCGTVTGGGLFVTKGLRPEIFLPVGTSIPAAISTDNQRAVYHLADAIIAQTNTSAIGGDLESKIDNLTQYFYSIDGTTNPTLFKYNIRAPLTVAFGRTTSAIVMKTAAGGALVGTASQANNVVVATLSHGPGANTGCAYFTTTTRVYRTNPLASMTSGSAVWVADNMVEVPPGSANTFAASSLMNSVEYSSIMDKLIIAVNAASIPYRSYVTQYKTDSSQFDRVWGLDNRQIDQSAADATLTPVPSMTSAAYSVQQLGGLAYIATIGTTAIANRVYAVPLGGDWEYASSSNARLLTPEIFTPNCDKFVSCYVKNTTILGGATSKNLGTQLEPFRVYYRTTGISDNSGSWTLLDDFRDMSGVAGATSIQFMFEFRTIGFTCLPARILSVSVLYNDLSMDSHYQPSVANSSTTSKRFAFRFASAFGSTVPTLRIRLYDAVSSGLLLDETTLVGFGTWEKSTDNGSTWSAYNTLDKSSETIYIRFSPLVLGDNIKVKALLTLA